MPRPDVDRLLGWWPNHLYIHETIHESLYIYMYVYIYIFFKTHVEINISMYTYKQTKRRTPTFLYQTLWSAREYLKNLPRNIFERSPILRNNHMTVKIDRAGWTYILLMRPYIPLKAMFVWPPKKSHIHHCTTRVHPAIAVAAQSKHSYRSRHSAEELVQGHPEGPDGMEGPDSKIFV